MTTPDEVIADRLAAIHADIDAYGRSEVTIVAVTKGFNETAIEAAQRVGLTHVGENYAQEVLEKVDAINPGTKVHFMGRVQRNKVRKIATHIDLWHSVARPEILIELAKRSPAPRALIQVRPIEDETKDGVRPDELDEMLDVARTHEVAIEGLMTIGILGDAARTKKAFIELDRLAAEYDLAHRSMGMSGDYRDALEAGATILRLGSVLFGDRPPRSS